MKKRMSIRALAIVLIMMLSACTNNSSQDEISNNPGQIYLYGETHGVEEILDKEFELWNEYYHDEGLRHLFIEYPYYTAEFLNIWMKSDNDDILDELYSDSYGTRSYTPVVKEFYCKIKSECPETVFHGTDIGHQYATTGERFLKHLQSSDLENSEQYHLAQEAIEQGKYFYEDYNAVYRENTMAENFIREFDKLDGESIMGIYGSAHTGLDAMDFTNTVECMANQLSKHYEDNIQSVDLSWLAKDMDPYRVDTINVDGKDYEASYFGKQDMTWLEDYTCREFWRLENAYDDFMDSQKTGDKLPYSNYPMLIEDEQVFVIDYTKTDGSVMRKYHLSDGYLWEDMLWTEDFIAE